MTGTGNPPFGTDPMLGPLADNGGPTETRALLPGSSAADAGSNPANLFTDQRRTGLARVFNGQADIGAFELQPLSPPTVASVKVNDGSAQRSRVTSLTVTFSQPVSYPNGPGAALQLVRVGPSAPTGGVALTVAPQGASVTFTFADVGTVPTEGKGSLRDGVYRLTIDADSVLGTAGQPLDGNGNGTPGGDFVTPTAPNTPGRIHRLFGDADVDADVDAADFGTFRGDFGGASFTFDSDGDGDADAADFGAFRGRFGASV